LNNIRFTGEEYPKMINHIVSVIPAISPVNIPTVPATMVPIVPNLENFAVLFP
jgi:hypothetical protein